MLPRIFLLLALVLLGPAQAEPARVAVVDVDHLFREYEVAKAKRGSIESLRERMERDPRTQVIADLRNELTALQGRLRDPNILPSEKDDLTRKLEMKGYELISLERDLRHDMKTEQARIDAELVELTRQLLADIRSEISAYAKRENFELVFEKSGHTSSQGPTLIYSRHAIDITADVLAHLNRNRDNAAENPADGAISSPSD